MDAQGRGRGGDIDPADQWVLDPKTGNYVLRLDAGGQSGPPTRSARSGSAVPRPTAGRGRDADAATGRSAGAGGGPDAARDRTSPRDRTTGRGGSAGRARDGSTSHSREAGVPEQRGHRRAAGRGQQDRAAGPPSRRKPKPRKSTAKKALYWGSGTLAFILVGGSLAAYLVYQHLNGNISKVDVGRNNAAVSDGPMNLLLIGTDKRDSKGDEGYGDAGSVGHADTTLIFHISADRTNATVLSIPRDLITDIPNCPTKQKDGTTKVIHGTKQTRFNTSLGQEGRDPGCTWRTAEKLTGLKINHFMMADFNAVKELSTAVGGVDVCLAHDVHDPKSHLNLSKGHHNVKGEQALAFVRTRHGVGFGSDLDRIKLQQQFLSSMLRKAKSSGTLSSPKKMWGLANTATKALTVDTGIGSVKKLIDLGQEVGKVDMKNVTFTTLPVVDNTDGATVLMDKPKAEPLLSMMKQDVSLTAVKKKQKSEKSKQEAKLKGTKAAPANVRVNVLNGSGQFGAAQETVDWMQNDEGMSRSTNAGNASSKLKKTTLEYAPNQADQARELAATMGLSGAALKEGTKDAAPMDPMKLTLGADFKGAGTPITAPTKAPEGIQKVEANDKHVCAK